MSVGFEWKLFTRAHIGFKRQSQISVRQRRIWGRNFKTKLVTFSVFSCFFRFSVRLCCMDKWIKMDGRKQENTEKVRSLVLEFLPQILFCLTLICDCLLNSMPPPIIQPSMEKLFWKNVFCKLVKYLYTNFL